LRVFNINRDANISKDSVRTLETSGCKVVSAQTFSLTISNKVWSEVKPSKKLYGRKYLVLKAGKWTHIFAEEIWKQTNIICAFSFKYAKVYIVQSAKCYTYFVARCKECKSKLKGYLYEKPRKKMQYLNVICKVFSHQLYI